MRKIYPKLITTLFLALFVAMILKYSDADSKSSSAKTASTSTVLKSN